MSVDRKEPTYLFTEHQVAEKSEIARRFLDTRIRLNANVDKADNFLVKRFYNIDHNTYLEGTIPAKYKELMGLVISGDYAAMIASTTTSSSLIVWAPRALRSKKRCCARGRRKHCDTLAAPRLPVAGRVV